ncbi:MAG: TrkA family potassium uptake protein [Coriobacteriia bacterium]|nr:TrkA family potassium uptake protein [Coriobacteriia bacterium]
MNTLIIGGGKVGVYLAQHLLDHGHEVTLIESRPERFEKLRGDIDDKHLICGDAADPLVLERVGIRSVEHLVCATGSDETNLIVAMLAKMEYGVRQVVARVNNPKNAWLFTPVMGVDSAVNQADLTARMLATQMDPLLGGEIFEEDATCSL